MFNVNNTYIRISGCIINVPLNQSVRLGNLHFVVASVNTPDTWDIEITI